MVSDQPKLGAAHEKAHHNQSVLRKSHCIRSDFLRHSSLDATDTYRCFRANLFISAIGGSVTALIPFDITGTLDITIDEGLYGSLFPGATNISTAISLDDAAIQLSDESLNLNLGFLGGVSGAITGAGINTLDSNGNIALTTTSPSDPFLYTFDPGGGVGGTDLAIDQGLFTYNGTGPIGGLLGSGTVDFGSDPVNAMLDPVGQIGLVTQDLTAQIGPTSTVEVVVSVPLTFVDTILTDPLVVDVDLSGVLYATGFYTILPEPSSILLLGIAIVAMIPLRRRLLGK